MLCTAKISLKYTLLVTLFLFFSLPDFTHQPGFWLINYLYLTLVKMLLRFFVFVFVFHFRQFFHDVLKD